MSEENIVEIENLEKSYGHGINALKVLKNISLSIKGGETISIVGPSGAGKSTLLNMMGCLDEFQTGKLSILGNNISYLTVEELSGFRNLHIGFIFQAHNLMPEFTALENVMIPLLIRRRKKKEARQIALTTIEKFNLLDRQNHKPNELSGGECQRIAVARAIVGNPDIILADEPTGNLDSHNSKQLIDILLKTGKKNNTTIIIVTHDMEIAGMSERKITIVDGNIINDVPL